MCQSVIQHQSISIYQKISRLLIIQKKRNSMPKNLGCRQGKWNKTEQSRFMKALSKHGKNWDLIQKQVKTRTLTQVRSHSQKLFLSMTQKQLIAFQKQLDHRFESFCKTARQQLAKANSNFLAQQDNSRAFGIQAQKNEESLAFIDTNQKIQTYSGSKKAQNNIKEASSTEESMEDTTSKGSIQKRENLDAKVQQNVVYSISAVEQVQSFEYGYSMLPIFFWIVQ